MTSLSSNYSTTTVLYNAEARTGTKQQRSSSDDRTTNLSRLIIIGNLRIDLFSACGYGASCWQKECVAGGAGCRNKANLNNDIEIVSLYTI